MKNDIKEILFTKEDLNAICDRLGKQITKDYAGKQPLFIGLLNGAVFFMTDLIRHVDLKCSIDFLKVSSYEGTHSTGNVRVDGHFPDVKGKDVIIVEDIIDTGKTLYELKNLMKEANSYKVCVLLDKKEARQFDVHVDYVGSVVPKKFVVGYGFDYNEIYRNLPYIGVLKEEVYM